MFCTKCKKEYAEGTTQCPDCNQELIEIPEEGIEIFEAMKPIKITSVKNSIEAGMIMNLLRNNGIACIKKDNGAGGYMNLYYGFSVFGEEIYVDEGDYQKAVEIIKELDPEQSVKTDMEQGMAEDESEDQDDDETENQAEAELEDQDNNETVENMREIEDDSYDNYPFYRNPRKLAQIYLIGSIVIGILIYILNKVINS